MKRKVLMLPAVVVFSGLALSGCTVNINAPAAPAQSHMMNSQGSQGEFSGADIMFAQMMIPHHQQAVDMGTLAETRASDASVKKLAAEIKAEQAPEIEQMQAWLTDAGAPTEMGHEMHMGGMLTEAELQQLSEATGAEFDRLYLEAMIAHHEGAIDMAQMILNSANPEVKALGEAIVASQTAQIEYMRELLAGL